MIQISFEPAYDAYHAMFRAARLINALPNTRIEYDKFRILDFYLCFPDLIDQLRLKPSDRKLARLARYQEREYAGKPDGRLAFSRMQPAQAAAAQTLALQGFFAPAELELGWAHAIKPIPAGLSARVNDINKEERTLIDFVKMLAAEYPLTGENGLKHRSGLLEYRYDIA